jgi:hypothetical protein
MSEVPKKNVDDFFKNFERKGETDFLDDLVEKLSKQLIEHCDSVAIVVTRDTAQATEFIFKKQGNQFAVYGSLKNALTDMASDIFCVGSELDE